MTELRVCCRECLEQVHLGVIWYWHHRINNTSLEPKIKCCGEMDPITKIQTFESYVKY